MHYVCYAETKRQSLDKEKESDQGFFMHTVHGHEAGTVLIEQARGKWTEHKFQRGHAFPECADVWGGCELQQAVQKQSNSNGLFGLTNTVVPVRDIILISS